MDRPDLLVSLRQSPEVLSAFVSTIPEDRLDIRRKDGFWTVAEHVCHLAQVQPMLLERLQRFLNEPKPVFLPYIPGEGEDVSETPERMAMEAALTQFTDIRNLQLALLEKADDKTWEKKATHPEYDQYSFYILTRHILMHDYWHMYRMEELWLTKDAYLTSL